MNTPIATDLEHRLDRFGYANRQILQDGESTVSERTAQRLSAARAVALARHKQAAIESAPAVAISIGASSARGRLDAGSSGRRFFGPRFSFALAALVLALGVIEFNDWQEQAQIDELAEIDLEILADEVPFTAHLDPNYRTLLTRAQ